MRRDPGVRPREARRLHGTGSMARTAALPEVPTAPEPRRPRSWPRCPAGCLGGGSQPHACRLQGGHAGCRGCPQGRGTAVTAWSWHCRAGRKGSCSCTAAPGARRGLPAQAGLGGTGQALGQVLGAAVGRGREDRTAGAGDSPGCIAPARSTLHSSLPGSDRFFDFSPFLDDRHIWTGRGWSLHGGAGLEGTASAWGRAGPLC